MPAAGTILDVAVNFAFVSLVLAMLLAMVRVIRGPTLPDRVVALDLLTILTVAFCAVLAISTIEPAFLDVAIVLALIAFLATVAFARFIERGQMHREEMHKNAEGQND
jgi:multicomponent Na+:H+ antiporter subunit F